MHVWALQGYQALRTPDPLESTMAPPFGVGRKELAKLNVDQQVRDVSRVPCVRLFIAPVCAQLDLNLLRKGWRRGRRTTVMFIIVSTADAM